MARARRMRGVWGRLRQGRRLGDGADREGLVLLLLIWTGRRDAAAAAASGMAGRDQMASDAGGAARDWAA
jgi:hypothetical protein